ncbi:hypothetical protein [Streptomyces sp. NPDC088812]|uniref:hypothetical protein n=1 Tax=Streptomyces sp. NPDC088812 TaxID=3365905 RepID=UPI0037FEF648
MAVSSVRHDWYADLPIASPQVFGDQTDVPEEADWWNAGYLFAPPGAFVPPTPAAPSRVPPALVPPTCAPPAPPSRTEGPR